jgi:hypothetical protein
MAKKAVKVTMEVVGKMWNEKGLKLIKERAALYQEILDSVCFMEQKGACSECANLDGCHARTVYGDIHGIDAPLSATCDLFTEKVR